MTPNDSSSIEWQSIKTFPPLESNEIHVWRIELTSNPAQFAASLSLLIPEEQARAHRTQQPQARHLFVIGRASLRLLLGNILDIGPHIVPITTGTHGKPEINLPNKTLSFNIAHSGTTIAIALSRQGSLGIDIEHIDPTMNFMEVARHSFTPNELKKLATDPATRLSAFYWLWTQKEAIVKADGRGLSLPLSSFEIPAHTPVAIDSPSGNKLFYLTNLPLGNTTAGTLATDSPGPRIRLLEFPTWITESACPWAYDGSSRNRNDSLEL